VKRNQTAGRDNMKRNETAKAGRATTDAGAKPGVERAVMPDVAATAALSFLKETKGALTWTTQEFAHGVGITVPQATLALAVLQMQGYIKQGASKNEWMTSVDGDAVSGATSPRFSVETVQQALSDLRTRIKAVNRDAKSEFKIASAVAFGDFLSERARVQAADVGVELVKRNISKARKAKPKAQERAFLKTLRSGKQMIRLVAFEPWMRERVHQRLL
jgi:hypothetical protein